MAHTTITSAEVLDLAAEIQQSCLARGYDLLLLDEQWQEVRAIGSALTSLNARLAMIARIQTVLDEHQAQLIAPGAHAERTPALVESWTRFRVAYPAFCRRVNTTQIDADLLARLHSRLLRRVLALVRKGVV